MKNHIYELFSFFDPINTCSRCNAIFTWRRQAKRYLHIIWLTQETLTKN